MSIDQWSTTAANNASGVTNVNWAEGQAPSTVNDSARNLMADVAAWYGQAKIPEYLTSVAGTNTVTATGPASMAAYAAGQRFTLLPANTNTGATTLNITPSGASALGAKNIFFRGAACVGGELVSNVPTSVLYDGTQFNILGPAPAFKAITTTRDISTASGNQGVTGVGFVPRAVALFFGNAGASDAHASVGVDDGTSAYALYNNAGGSAGAFRIDTSHSLVYNTSEGVTSYTGKITSLDADGFTIAWTKTGSPTGTMTITALCFR